MQLDLLARCGSIFFFYIGVLATLLCVVTKEISFENILLILVSFGMAWIGKYQEHDF